MRLIDADALGIGKCNSDVFENKAYADGWNAAVGMIENAPTVDAEPVKHGKWKTDSDRADCLICSLCDCAFDMWKHEAKYFKFCPNCGAKMTEEKENE